MGESLWEIAEQPFFYRIVFFGEKADVVAQIEQALEEYARIFFAPDQMIAIGQPKGARKKNSLVTWQPVDLFFFGPIAQDESILEKIALDGRDRASRHVRRSPGENPRAAT